MVTEELNIKIMIFEDDDSILTMLCDFFSTLGAEVVSSSDGGGALQYIASEKPDIVLLDVVMPIQDGYSIVRDLRQASFDVPVILLTDKKSIDDKVLGLNSGADDYLCKPFSPKELLARVKAQLRRIPVGSINKNAVLQFGRFSIDPKTRVASVDDNPVPFTKTEFDLLYYLASKSPGVIPHTDLIRDVLGYNPEVETKALVMHIMNLRKKLNNHDIETFEIKAVPGVGYKVIT